MKLDLEGIWKVLGHPYVPYGILTVSLSGFEDYGLCQQPQLLGSQPEADIRLRCALSATHWLKMGIFVSIPSFSSIFWYSPKLYGRSIRMLHVRGSLTTWPQRQLKIQREAVLSSQRQLVASLKREQLEQEQQERHVQWMSRAANKRKEREEQAGRGVRLSECSWGAAASVAATAGAKGAELAHEDLLGGPPRGLSDVRCRLELCGSL